MKVLELNMGFVEEEVVKLFFHRAKRIQQEKGRPMRLQLVGGAGKTHIYATRMNLFPGEIHEKPTQTRRKSMKNGWKTA